MTELFIWIITTFVLFIVFVSMTFIALKRKRKVFFLFSILTLLLFLGCAAVTVYKIISKTYSEVKSMAVLEKPVKRDGLETYEEFFGKSIDSCFHVTGFKDHLVPLLDCCIWMKLDICPEELNRVLSQKDFTVTKS